jgi:CheY-like chemotaxis protein
MPVQSSALILLVEDDELSRAGLEDALLEGGFEVKLAGSGTGGLALFGDSQGQRSRPDNRHKSWEGA